MVTVVEMSPEDFPGEIAGSYGEACAALGVTSAEGGYGLVLDQDEAGARWTQVTTDVQGVRTVRSIWNTDIECGYEPPSQTATATLLVLIADAPRKVLDVSGVDQASALLDALTAAAGRSAGG